MDAATIRTELNRIVFAVIIGKALTIRLHLNLTNHFIIF